MHTDITAIAATTRTTAAAAVDTWRVECKHQAAVVCGREKLMWRTMLTAAAVEAQTVIKAAW